LCPAPPSNRAAGKVFRSARPTVQSKFKPAPAGVSLAERSVHLLAILVALPEGALCDLSEFTDFPPEGITLWFANNGGKSPKQSGNLENVG
jgi:hypothetical protein